MTALGWGEVADRFSAAQTWWVATAGEQGPHAVPVWGVVVDGVLHFYGAPAAVRSRNLARDPRIVVHLESGSEVLVVHGSVAVGGVAAAVPSVVSAYTAKYTDPSDLPFLPDAPDMVGVLLFTVVPSRAFAWDLTGSADWDTRRWVASAG